MGQYVVTRILLIVPTLVLVMMIAFFLSRLVPGDQASSLLRLQGIQPEDKNAATEYVKNYIKFGMDKPVFYISVVPDYYPKNINALTSQNEREQVRQLLNQKIPFDDISRFITNKKIAASDELTLVGDSVSSQTLVQTLKKLDVISDFSEIYTLSTELSQNKGQNPSSVNALISSIDQMALSQKTWYYPIIYWHGIDNQFHRWFANMFKGDFGISNNDGRKVGHKILEAAKWTSILLLLNIIFSSMIAIPSGLYAGFRENSLFDKLNGFIWLIFYAMPVFWLASVLIIFFTSGRYGNFMNIFPTPGDWTFPSDLSVPAIVSKFSQQLVLPVFCLVANDIAMLSRVVRNNVVEQKTKQYFAVAKAKGISDWKIMKNHLLPNVLLPVVTIIGSRIPAGLSGSLIIEVIFNIPGMGRLIFDSITTTDWNVVFSILLLVSIFTVVFMLITDIIYAIVNPKINTSLQ